MTQFKQRPDGWSRLAQEERDWITAYGQRRRQEETLDLSR